MATRTELPVTGVGHQEDAAPPVEHGRGVSVQLLHVPDCPLVDSVHDLLPRCSLRTGLQVVLGHLEGPYPSRTVLVNGGDATGRLAAAGPSCASSFPPGEILTLTAAAVLVVEPEGDQRCA